MRYWYQVQAESRVGAVLNYSPALSHLILPTGRLPCFTLRRLRDLSKEECQDGRVQPSPTQFFCLQNPESFHSLHRKGRGWKKETNGGEMCQCILRAALAEHTGQMGWPALLGSQMISSSSSSWSLLINCLFRGKDDLEPCSPSYIFPMCFPLNTGCMDWP